MKYNYITIVNESIADYMKRKIDKEVILINYSNYNIYTVRKNKATIRIVKTVFFNKTMHLIYDKKNEKENYEQMRNRKY